MNDETNNQNETSIQSIPTRNESVLPSRQTASPVAEPEEVSEEEKELKETTINILKYPKLCKWVELFLDKDSPETFGNRTESAMRAYKCKNRITAGQIGSQNYKKLKGLAGAFADAKGMTFNTLITKAYSAALSSENPAWWDRVMQITGYIDPNQPQVVVNNNTQNNVQVNEAEAKDFSSAFKRFLENE